MASQLEYQRVKSGATGAEVRTCKLNSQTARERADHLELGKKHQRNLNRRSKEIDRDIFRGGAK